MITYDVEQSFRGAGGGGGEWLGPKFGWVFVLLIGCLDVCFCCLSFVVWMVNIVMSRPAVKTQTTTDSG